MVQGNAEKSRIIMVGDTLKRVSESSGGKLIEVKDFGDTEYGFGYRTIVRIVLQMFFVNFLL